MPHKLTFARVVFAVVLATILLLAKPSWVPGLAPGQFNLLMVGGCVVFLLLGGAYVLFRSRGEDLEHYQSRSAGDPDATRALQKRYQTIGVMAWSMTVGGVAAAIVLAVKLLHLGG